MKALVQRRREDGAVISTPAPVVDGASPLNLVVVGITEEGNRRPIRVPRLQPLGGFRPSSSSTLW